MSTTSGLGGIFGFEVVCRDPLGTCSFAGLLECGGLSLGGMLVVCRGAIVFCGDSVLNATNSRSSETDLDSDTSVLAVVLGLGRGRRVRCTLGANVVLAGTRAVVRTTVAGTSVLRALDSRSVAATGLVRGASGVVVLGLGRTRWVRFGVLGAFVVTQVSVLSVTGSRSLVGTGLDSATSGLGIGFGLGRGRCFICVFLGASVVTWTSGLRVTGSRTTAGTVFVLGA